MKRYLIVTDKAKYEVKGDIIEFSDKCMLILKDVSENNNLKKITGMQCVASVSYNHSIIEL